MAMAQDAALPLFARDNPEPGQPLLLLMDGHAMVHRSFRAISTQRHLTISGTGEDVTGVYGFTNVFLRALNDWRPTHCAIAFDTPAPTFRHQQFPDYKAQREAAPPELRPQFDRAKQLMTAFGVPIFTLDGYEADDLIGTLSRQAAEQGINTVILTGDRDTFQLISPQVRVDLSYNIQDRKVYDEVELAARYGGLTAAQQPDFKSLLGDSSDNIPGVPRIGEKRAIGLLSDYQTLEGIYEHLDAVKPPSVRQSLSENKELAFANRLLTTIDRDAPVELSLTAARSNNFDRQQVVRLLTELEFHSIISRLPNPIADADRPAVTPSSPDAETAPTDYITVQTEEQLDDMLAALRAAGGFAFDTETTAVNPMHADLVGLSFAVAPGQAWYLPLLHQEGPQLPLETTLAKVKALMESPDLEKCAHNANFDLMMLANYGIAPRNVNFDTMIAAHLLSKNNLGLKPLSLDMLGIEMTPIKDLIGSGKKQITFDQVPIPDAAPYAAADADMTVRLIPPLQSRVVAQPNLNSLMSDLEIPLTAVLVAMQRHGIKLDVGLLQEMSGDLRQQLQQAEQDLYDTIGHQVNLNSPQQLGDVLFNELGLPKTKRTKTGYSTDANALEGLKAFHPIINQILVYRQVAKLKSTYVDALPGMINPHTGRIHTNFNQVGSATGRMSSSDPNLQNIPIRTPVGRQIRKAFIAEPAPDWVLFSADYSQIELRVLAHLSQDPALLDAFRRGEDIHASTAALMNAVPINEVNSEQRRIAKVLNFGVIYGLSPHGISQQTGFSREDGARFITTYFNQYPGISGYLETVKQQTRETQYVETLLGRRRYVPDITASNFNSRSAAERMAINMPVQGTAADIMKLAMLRVHHRLQQEKLQARMLLQVHDELVFEVPRSEMDALQEVVFAEMPAAMNLDVTLKVEAKWGETWGDME